LLLLFFEHSDFVSNWCMVQFIY